jgi:hypothetical protein
VTAESLYVLGSDATAAPVEDGMLQAVVAPDQTTTTLLRDTARLRYRTHHLGEDASTLHRRATILVVRESSREYAKKSVSSLLDILSNGYGLAWSAIAQLVGVSIPGLRKWRTGQAFPSAEHHARLAELAAMLQHISDSLMIEDPAAWLELPLAGTDITVLDVYRVLGMETLIDYASQWSSTEQVLDRYAPDWRDQAQTPYEVFVAEDGQPSLRLKDTRHRAQRP